MSQKEFRTISKRAKQALRETEGIDFEFKETLKAATHEQLVSFANSPKGGCILVGIREKTNAAGVQRGEIVGCPIDDDAVMQIQNKASNCHPPIKVEIYKENLNKTPFLRLEINSGERKPYRTIDGKYVIRMDGKKRALTQEELLSIFLKREEDKFISIFERSTKDLGASLNELKESVKNDIYTLYEEMLEDYNDIKSSVEEASMDASSAADEAYKAQQQLTDTTFGINSLRKEISTNRRVAAAVTRGESFDEVLYTLTLEEHTGLLRFMKSTIEEEFKGNPAKANKFIKEYFNKIRPYDDYDFLTLDIFKKMIKEVNIK